MPVDRPTFSESWYRVAQLRPKLRSTVQVHRQHFRGRMWYVLQDPSNNQFFRQNESAYHFVALLDGRRTIAEVWEACNQELGDAAPTQGEAIQLLGQLYASNLLQGEMPPDAQGLFSRYRKRVQREVQGYLMNLLFIRIPLFDPDAFLDRWVKFFGKVFTIPGMILWMMLVSAGLYFVVNNIDGLTAQSNSVLDPENLPLLYVSFVLIKVIHEFGHAFACKKFGQEAGGGEVHVMGVMFLVFTPLPYVDATSSYAFRNKWQRVVVGAGGMLVELAVASIAAIVWANTDAGTVHAIAYNMMFIASVSTLLFNANPLLRYDGYYILTDLIEIPNLSQRAKQYIYYVVKKYAWGVRHVKNPAHTPGEQGWFFFYGIASTIYRVFICARILLFVADKLFFVGAILAVAAIGAWVLVPLGKFVHYLATSGELMRVRPRAVGTTAATLVVVLVLIGLIPWPDRHRIEGVVEPVNLQIVYATSDGFLDTFVPTNTHIEAGEELAVSRNVSLQRRRDRIAAELAATEIRRQKAQTEDVAEYMALGEKVATLQEQLAKVDRDIANLTVRAKVDGVWVSPNVEDMLDAYVQRGDPLGMVASLDHVIIRATAGQQVAAMLIEEARRAQEQDQALTAELRVKNRPRPQYVGVTRAADILQAGQKQLPSQALGYAVGGSMATDPQDQRGTQTLDRFFEVRVRPQIDQENPDVIPLQAGQRVLIRYDLPKKPLMQQWYRSLLQLIQKRFHV